MAVSRNPWRGATGLGVIVVLAASTLVSTGTAAQEGPATPRQAALASNGGFATEHQILTANGEERLAPWPIDTSGGSFSPDGRALAWHNYRIRRGADYSALWVTDAAGSREVAQLDQQLDVPTWSPDGTRVAVAGQSTNSQLSTVWTVTIIPMDGSGPPVEVFRVRDGDHWKGLAWSPDGSRIAFARGLRDIFTYDVESGALQQVTRGCVWDAPDPEDDEGGPACAIRYGFGSVLSWSPDGTRIAAVDRKSVVIVDVASGAVTTLVSGRKWLQNALWSPDGAWIAYGVHEEGSFVVPATGGEPKPVASTVVSSWQPCPGGACPVLGEPRARSRIVVRPRVAGRTLTLEGQVKPADDRERWRESARVVVQVRAGRSWRKAKALDVWVDASRFSRKIPLPQADRCRVKVTYAGGWTRTPARAVKSFRC